MLKTLKEVIEYETSKIINYKFQIVKIVTKKWVNKSKKLNLTQFHKKDETLFEYSHQNG